ncbi:MAG: nucleotidyltransferase family protein [Bacteroidales bacterium]|jgi:glucose-1-phosphate thymidylyltransferase|nr:nucleotidyltransferase family protein [Bacteroidales bacterium]MCI2133628.1 nucleotidyltransferase family protein [Bacteroidales bacterium]
MKCLILAAGYATRLYPLTENFPKPLLDVGGKTILDWLLDDVEASGKIDEYAVVTNHKFACHFEKWASGRSEKITVVDDGTTTNETRLGAVRDIQYALEKTGFDDDIIIMAGDNLLNFSLIKFIEYAIAAGTSCIMRYYEPSEAKLHKCGVVEVNEHDLILSMEEKPAEPRSHWCCPPFYFYRMQDVARIPEGMAAGCGVDAPGSFVAWLATKVPIRAMEMPGHRYDIGTLDSYKAVQATYQGIH